MWRSVGRSNCKYHFVYKTRFHFNARLIVFHLQNWISIAFYLYSDNLLEKHLYYMVARSRVFIFVYTYFGRGHREHEIWTFINATQKQQQKEKNI